MRLGNQAQARKIYQWVAGFSQNTMERSLAYPEAVQALDKLG